MCVCVCVCVCCCFSRVRLCATLCTVASQAPLSMGFSRQECWSGLPCPSPISKICVCLVEQLCPALCELVDCSPPSSSVQARILEWVVIPFSRGIFLTQGSNPHLLHWQVDSLPLSHQGSLLLKIPYY